MKEKLVFLTGAGISQESGLATFRDNNGLWENHDPQKVASIDYWYTHPEIVLEFYNQRRKQLKTVEPNLAHKLAAKLEDYFDVFVITQNVDNLHERAGSSYILHLHGELFSAKSVKNPELVYQWEKDLNLGDKAEDGSQLRPNIVWFGEPVPNYELAIPIIQEANILAIVGTSLQVTPASLLYKYADSANQMFVIDPNVDNISLPSSFVKLPMRATDGMKELYTILTGDLPT